MSQIPWWALPLVAVVFALAGAAGVATIPSPCILPALPIVLATTAGGEASCCAP